MSGSGQSIQIKIAPREWFQEKLEVQDNLAAEWEALLGNMLGGFGKATIFKRKSKADGLRAVAIGPYHHNCESLLGFDNEFKWKITRHMVAKWSLDIKKYLEEMHEDEEYARSCYNESLSEWSSKEFRMMLLLDSCFVLFAMDAFCRNLSDSEDLLRSRELFMEYMALYLHIIKHTKQIQLDLLMADNQIPFFAVEKLLECFGNMSIFREYSIKKLALSYFHDLWPMRNEEQNMDDGTEFDHLLHLFHQSRVPIDKYETNKYEMGRKEQNGRSFSLQYIPSATELQKSAIKFEKKDSGSNLDITFRRRFIRIFAVINIPTLHLYDYSEEIFRNLIAFEGNPGDNVHCFTAYSACMSCLLQREDDAKLLRERGIIASTSYDDTKVVEFFKGLNREVKGRIMPDSTLLQLYGSVMEHHKSRVSNAYGDFTLQYCPNMWVGLSLVAASMLFILTLLQTIYAIMHK